MESVRLGSSSQVKRKKKGVEFKKNTNAKLFEMGLYIKGLLRCEIFFRQNRFSIYSVFMLTSPKLIFVLPTYETDYYQILLRISLEIKEKSNVLISSFCCLFVCLSLSKPTFWPATQRTLPRRKFCETGRRHA